MRRVLILVPLLVLACGGDGSAPSSTTDPNNPGGGSSSSGNTSGAPGSPDGGTTSPVAPKRIAFVAMGDTGTGSADQKKVANAIEALCTARGCDFVQLL